MSTAAVDREVRDLALQARGLELVRDLLAVRGATSDELESHTRELERVRRQLLARLFD